MTQWNLDPTHSSVNFTVRHMMFAKVHGVFRKWSATFDIDDADLTKSKLTASIDATSVDTGEEKRDGHLQSPDFLDAATYPKLEFTSKSITKSGDDYKVTGDLTIHGVTKEIVLDVEHGGRGKDPWGNERIGFEAKTHISRGDYGLKWNQALEAGGVLVADKVDISIVVEAVKGK